MPVKRAFNAPAESGLAAIFANKGPKTVEAISTIAPNATEYPPFQPDESSWGADYAEHKSKFRRAVLALRPAIFESINLRTPDGSPILDENKVPLSTDIAFFGNVTNPKRCFITTCGVHGTEGFAGSAGHIAFLRRVASGTAGLAWEPDAVYIFVHAVNPWGMAFGRRWNENGVDLNRNQYVRAALSPLARRVAQSPYEARGTAPAYHKVAPLLSTKVPVPGFVDTALFFLVAGVLLAFYGFKAMRQALVGGQDTYPTAPFYGGVRLESGPRAMWERIIAFFKGLPQTPTVIVSLDLHTGLGAHAHGFGITDTMSEYTWWCDALAPVITQAKGAGLGLSIDPPGGNDSYNTGGDTRTGLLESLMVISDERAKPGMGASGFSGRSTYAAAAAKMGVDSLRTVVGASEVGEIPLVPHDSGFVVLPGGEHVAACTVEIGTYGNLSVLLSLRRECGEFNAAKAAANKGKDDKVPFHLPAGNAARQGVVDAFRPPTAKWEAASELVFVGVLEAAVGKLNKSAIPA